MAASTPPPFVSGALSAKMQETAFGRFFVASSAVVRRFGFPTTPQRLQEGRAVEQPLRLRGNQAILALLHLLSGDQHLDVAHRPESILALGRRQ